MTERYKRFPPGWGNIKVPTSSRGAALAGLSMYAACRWRGVWAQRLAWAATWLLGPRGLPGRRSAWQPPMEPEVFLELCSLWRAELGGFEALAVHERRQTSRPGIAVLLLERGGPVAFLKLRPQIDGELDREAEALSLMARSRPRSFWVPRLLALGEHRGWRYLGCTPLPPQIHRAPRFAPLVGICQEIELGLAELGRPEGTPSHWRPMHGDLTPWNLRRLAGEDLVLTDWERAGWGPPGADEILYQAAQAALGREPWEASPYDEAVEFWRRRIQLEPADDRDHRFRRLLARTLEEMAKRPA
jgi:hypothetical protein